MNDNRGIHGIPGHNSVVTRKFLDALKSRGESPEFTIAKSYRWSRKMSPPDSLQQIRINNLWIWSQIPVLKFSLLPSFSSLPNFAKGMLKIFTEIERKEQRRIKFFLPSFLFRFPKKKKKKGKQSSGVITNETVVHEIGAPHPLHRFLERYWCWVELEPVLYNTRISMDGG